MGKTKTKMNKELENDDWCHYSDLPSPISYMSKETYSIPIYENGVKTEWTIDGIVGDEKYQQLIEMIPEKKLPEMVNVNLKQKQL